MSKLPWTSFRAFSSSSHLASSSKPIQHTVRRSWRPIDPLRTTGRRAFSGPAPFPTSGRASLLRPLNMLVVIIPFFTFSLGVWQVKRLRWKLDLIDEIQRNIEKDPMILPPNINIAALPDFAFRRVLLRGVVEGPPILLGPAVEHGVPGAYLIQPFHRAEPGASTIMLNRGFITKTRADAIRAGTQTPGGEVGQEVIIEGMLTKKFDEGKGSWQHDNQPEQNLWFWKDIPGMAEWFGGDAKGVQPVLVDAIDRGDHPPTMLMQAGIPLGRPATVEIRNQHATYAMTWFSLSAATAGMLIYLLRKGNGARKLPKTMRPV